MGTHHHLMLSSTSRLSGLVVRPGLLAPPLTAAAARSFSAAASRSDINRRPGRWRPNQTDQLHAVGRGDRGIVFLPGIGIVKLAAGTFEDALVVTTGAAVLRRTTGVSLMERAERIDMMPLKTAAVGYLKVGETVLDKLLHEVNMRQATATKKRATGDADTQSSEGD